MLRQLIRIIFLQVEVLSRARRCFQANSKLLETLEILEYLTLMRKSLLRNQEVQRLVKEVLANK